MDIAFGKVLNAGQMCIAPDYALVPKQKVQSFLGALQIAVNKYYPEGTGSACNYTSVVNDRHYKRLSGYLEEARTKGVQVVALSSEGEESEDGGRKIAPVALVDPPESLKIMHEEIFGPVLIIKPYDELDDAIKYINNRPRPLALYLFTKSRSNIEKVLSRTTCGGVTINDTIMHHAAEDLPFGGVGPSGMGHYHGREGFDTFSKLKPVFERLGPRTDRLLRPPFNVIHDFLMGILISR
jgi:coniferyl-aldehyde dehydrogenase